MNEVADDLEGLATTLATVLRFLNRQIERKVDEATTSLQKAICETADALTAQVGGALDTHAKLASVTELEKVVEKVEAFMAEAKAKIDNLKDGRDGIDGKDADPARLERLERRVARLEDRLDGRGHDPAGSTSAPPRPPMGGLASAVAALSSNTSLSIAYDVVSVPQSVEDVMLRRGAVKAFDPATKEPT